MALRVDKRKVLIAMAEEGIETKKQLAQLSGLDQGTVREILNGRWFEPRTLDKLACALHRRPLDLLSDETDPHQSAPARECIAAGAA